MRIAFILLVLGVLQASAIDAYAQKTRISINFTDARLISVLDKIEEESEFFFLYNEKLLDTERKVSIVAENQLINVILDKVLEGTDAEYTIIDRKIIISPESMNKATDDNGQQQNRITGFVKDRDGLAVPGANVQIKGTTLGAITDIDGKYTIDVPSGSKTLVFSFIGMQQQEVAIGNQTQINVIMVELATALDEVVVIGYGTTTKRNIASSTAALKSEEIVGLSTTDTKQALQGKMAGVKVVNNSGDPGSGARVVIRGIGSFTSTEPLYVIDGIQGGDLNSIPPQNIESITVLKDASTTAIYGSAAANGVVLITTKSGVKGKVNVTYDGSIGVDAVTKQLDLLNAQEYLDLVTDIQTTNGQSITDKLKSEEVLVDRTDWQDVMFRNGRSTEHLLGLSGGNENATYAFSAGYQSKESTVIANNFRRFTINAKASENLFNKKVLLTQNIRLKNDIVNGVLSSFQNGLRMPPYTPLYDSTNLGGYGRADKATDLNDANNPADQAYNTDYERKKFNGDFDFGAEINITKSLKFKSQGRVSFWNGNDHTFNFPTKQGNFTRMGADMAENFLMGSDFILENFFSYSKTFGKHDLTATLGNTYDPAMVYRSMSGTGSGFSSLEVQNISLANTKSITGASVNSGSSRLSYFGRLGYTYNSKYILNASLRRDASSKFGANNRWGTFYGFGFAWAASQEEFIKNINGISDLKFRFSYGKLGNDNIPSFLGINSVWKGNTNNVVYSFGDNLSFASGSTGYMIPNPDLKWEETKQLDIGFDLGLLKNRLRIVMDYFHRNNQDLLIETLVPYSSGVGLPNVQGTRWVNAASMVNTGLEATITFAKNDGDFRWDISLNGTLSTNEVTALGTVGNLPLSSGNFLAGIGNTTRTDIGQPIASFFGYALDHIVSSQAEVDALNTSAIAATGGSVTQYSSGLKPGDRVWKDIDGNGYIDPNDRTFIGNPSPKWQYGATINSYYKGFDFQVMLFGVADVEVLNGNKYWFQGMSKPFNETAEVLDRWKADGDNVSMPRAGQNSGPNLIASSWYVENGSYFKVKNITLGYTLPKTTYFGTLEKIRIYIAVQNALTITGYSGYDPEVSSNLPEDDKSYIFMNGIDFYQHPTPRIFRFGLQLNF
jgi:TonB-dependent starch-binding outer membrane protein SusC